MGFRKITQFSLLIEENKIDSAKKNTDYGGNYMKNISQSRDRLPILYVVKPQKNRETYVKV